MISFRRKTLLCSVFISVVLLTTDLLAYRSSETITRDFQDLLRHRIEAQPIISGDIEVMGEPLYSRITLPEYYIETGFAPLWIRDNLTNAYRLRQVILESFDHGMNPAFYHIHLIDQLLPQYRSPEVFRKMSVMEQVDLDLLLTDAFLILASHHLAGQLDPASLDPNWRIIRHETDYKAKLFELRDGANADDLIRSFYPVHEQYHQLQGVLVHYRAVSKAGGWPEIPSGPTFREGENDPRVPLLRSRLHLTGDLMEAPTDTTFFDAELAEAAKRFQRRHGLTPDAVIGARTLQALNTPVETRLKQTIANLERWRWLRQDLGDRHIRVNIANFFVEVVENGEVIKGIRAIVGRPFRQTPVFSSRMTYLVLSPFWHLPPGISQSDILPRLKADPAYAVEQNIKIFEGWGSDATPIDPFSVDWKAISPTNLRYRFRQDPGPNNALGDVKFMFPNPYHVYLHDTPARNLFDQTVRDFSSGCIRVENPLDLTEYLLAGNTGWNREAITRAVNRRTEQTVTLANPIWVHILYWTAWADSDGTIHFRDDIYNRDTPLLEAITNKIQTPLISFTLS